MAALATKRKRDSQDMPGVRPPPAISMMGGNDFEQQYFHMEDDGANESMNLADVLAQHSAENGNAIEEAQEDHEAPPEPNQHHQHQHEHEHERSQQHGNEQPQVHHQEQNPSADVEQSASDTAAAAMAHYHTMTIPQTTEQSFLQQTQQQAQQQQDESGDGPEGSADPQSAHRRTSSFTDFDVNNPLKEGQAGRHNSEGSPSASLNPNMAKPSVGSEEWHKVRRDNHKEVERRRRETINEGINELAKIVPGCEKNKGSILARAVQFITQLKENETQNIEKWTLEKMVTEQSITVLSSSCDKLKTECQRAWTECEQWKKAAQKAGVSIEPQDSKGEGEGEHAG
ncbi:hypothetical protein KC332_g18667 [Hortaea werneckii]|nr:hypothetical protein KC329_g18760 [Hortaea werneckii]KAI7375280.1 hypothetical protein KC332_g18667 [Hortaea werneckii]